MSRSSSEEGAARGGAADDGAREAAAGRDSLRLAFRADGRDGSEGRPRVRDEDVGGTRSRIIRELVEREGGAGAGVGSAAVIVERETQAGGSVEDEVEAV